MQQILQHEQSLLLASPQELRYKFEVYDSTELLTNAGLETWASATDATGWLETVAGSSSVNRESSDKHAGSYAARLDIDASNNAAYIYQGVTLKDGYYTFSVWHKCAAAMYSYVLITSFSNEVYLNSSGLWQKTSAMAITCTSTTWTQYSITFKANPDYKGIFFCLLNGVNTSTSIYWDDASLKREWVDLASIYPTQGAEMLVNAGLDSWASAIDCNSWTEEIGGTSSVNREATEVFDGDYAAKFICDASGNKADIYQVVTLVAGERYRLTGWYKTTYANAAIIVLSTLDFAHYYDAASDSWSSTNSWNYQPAATAWRRFTFDFTTQSDHTSFVVGLGAKNVANAVVYFDKMSLVALPPAAVRSDALAGWAYRKQINVKGTYVDATLAHFPLLVQFKGDSDLGAACRSDGHDIRFTAHDGQTLLKHERESFSIVNGAAWGSFWVRVPEIVAARGADIFVYYGNVGAADGTSASAVWDSNFKAVFHMKDATTSTILDSTANNNDGSKTANNPLDVLGKIGRGQQFDGTNHPIDCGANINPGTQSISTSAWAYFNTQGNCLFDSRSNPGGTIWDGFLVGWAASTFYLILNSNQSAQGVFSYAYTPPISAWFHCALSWSQPGLSAALYINGQKIADIATAGIAASLDGDAPMKLGYDLGGSYYLSGKMDEARISIGIVRSAAWIKFDYRNMSESDNCIAFSTQQQMTTNYVKSVSLSVSGAGKNTEPIAGSWGATLDNEDGVFHPYHATSGYAQVLRLGSRARISVGAHLGGVVSFDGVDDCIDVADHASLDITAEITLAAWVLQRTRNLWATIITKGLSSGWTTNNYTFGLQSGRVDWRFGSGSTLLADAGDALSLNVWHHVVCVAEVGTTNALKIFIDGTLKKQGDRGGTPTANSDVLRFASDNGTSDNLDGALASVRIFNRALTSTEVARLYSTQLFSSTGIAGEWLFSEDAGLTANDTSGVTTNHGTLTSGVTRPRASTYWQRMIGFMDTPRFESGARSISLAGTDYMRTLADTSLHAGETHWGAVETFDSVSSPGSSGTEIYDEADACEIGAGELDNVTNWSAVGSGNVSSEGPAEDSLYYLRFERESSGNVAESCVNVNVGSLTAGNQYLISFDQRAIIADGGYGQLKVYQTVGASFSLVATINLDSNVGWQAKSDLFTCTSTGACKLILYTTGKYSTAGDFYDLDNISIKVYESANWERYNLDPSCNGVYFATLDDAPIAHGNEDGLGGWHFDAATCAFYFSEDMVIQTGNDNLKIYYFTDVTLEDVVADLLVTANLYASRATAKAAMSYTATGITLERCYFDEGTTALDAVRMLCERANYRFWFDHAGVPHFHAAPQRADNADMTFTSLSQFSALTLYQDISEVRNRITIEGAEMNIEPARDELQNTRFTAEIEDAASIALYQEKTYSLSNVLFDSQAACSAMATAMLDAYKTPKFYVEITTDFCALPLEIGDTIILPVPVSLATSVTKTAIVRSMNIANGSVSYVCEIWVAPTYTLIVQDARHAHSAESPAPYPAGELQVSECFHALKNDTITMSQTFLWTSALSGTNFTIPAGYTSAAIECWGAGGDGADGEMTGRGGGGGGGAYSKKTISVATSDVLVLYLSDNYADDTYVTKSGATQCLAKSGAEGTLSAGGQGGQASSGTGDTKYSGGNGYYYATGYTGGGGGSSAGTAANGNNATSSTGASAVTGGGNGGNGGARYNDGSAPTTPPGGGGGGAGADSGAETDGGQGSAGKIRITLS